MNALKWSLLVMLLWPFPAAAGEWVEGEVKRVDTANGKVTIKHGEIIDLEMPPMTMVFIAKDPGWVEQLKPGQAVRFQVSDLGGGRLQIEAIEPKSE